MRMSIVGGGIGAPAKNRQPTSPQLGHTQPSNPSKPTSVTFPDRSVTFPESAVTFPDRSVTISRNTQLAVAWTLATSKRHDEAIKLVRPLLDDAATDPGQRCESAEICASAALFADDFDEMERIIAPWAGALRTLPATQHVVGINQLAVTALYRGMPEKARYHYREIPSERALNIGHYTRGLMDWVIGASHLWQGQVLLADEHLRPALARAEDERGRRSPVAAMLASALAMALWEEDLTDELAPLLAHRLDVLERRCPPDTILMG